MRWRILLSLLGAWLLISLGARAAEVIPPAPPNHFNDYAGIVPRATAQSLDAELTQFERETSNQLLVAIYPHMQSDSSIEDYTVRVAQSWGVGLKGKKNGAVLFIFSNDHKLYIQVGYGLEGALPDALCKQIIANEITPLFRSGDYAGGVTAGVHALMAAAKGEYKGTGASVADGSSGRTGFSGLALIFFFVIVVSSLIRRRGTAVYGRGGRIVTSGGGGFFGGGGGSSGGGGGSFSGGGGSFGGGGAGGSW
ncbi:MAG: TPM domain-containing protein [Opitutaceae bacterium]